MTTKSELPPNIRIFYNKHEGGFDQTRRSGHSMVRMNVLCAAIPISC
jgi:hypothetical protein